MISTGSVRVRPSAVGWAILVTLGVAMISGTEAQPAIGFFIPILGFMAADAFFGWRRLTDTKVELTPIRTVAGSPDRLTFRASPSPSRATVGLRLAPMVPTDSPGGLFRLDRDRPTMIAQADGSPRRANFVRYQLSTSTLGLASTSRWEVRQVPGGLHRAPASVARPGPHKANLDDVARLREYVPGDRFSRVSWSATARTGQLFVRDSGLGDEELLVVLDLGLPGPGAQAPGFVLNSAAQIIGNLIERGFLVRLVTRELSHSFYDHEQGLASTQPNEHRALTLTTDPDGTVRLAGRAVNDQTASEFVVDERELLVRLATAEPGPPIPRPESSYIEITGEGARVVS